jgi:hypothetical protein
LSTKSIFPSWGTGARQLDVAQIGRLVTLEIQVDGIQRHDRSEERTAVDPTGNQVASRHLRTADTPVDGTRDSGEGHVEVRGLERGRGSCYVGFRLRHRAFTLVDFLLGNRTAFLEVSHALLLDFGELERGAETLQVRRGTVIVGLVRPRIDDKQQFAALHHFAFGEGHEVDIPGHSRADLDGFHGLQAARELIPIRDALLQHLRDTDFGWRRGGGCAGTATAGSRQK